MLEAELEKAETALKSADDDEALRHLTSAIEHLKGLQRGKAA